MDRFAGFASEIKQTLEGCRYDIGIIEHFWCAPYADPLRPFCDRLLLNLHNIESVLLDRYAATASNPVLKPMFRRWASTSRRLESEWLPKFDLVLAASKADADRLPVPAIIYPNTIPLVSRCSVGKRLEVVFSGNMEYLPNYTAVKWFAREIWPRLRERCAGVVWRIAGKNEHAIRSLIGGDPRIIASGPMDDAIRTLAESTIAVVPLLTGSGTRIKIIEAWAAGLPVVSTTLGAEGLPATPGEHLLLADSPEAFVQSVVKILQTPDLLCRLSEAGRRLYEQRLTWEAAWNILNQTGL